MEYVKRVAGGAEIACGGGGVHIDKRGEVVEAENNACYYKRDTGELVRRIAGGAEIACGGGGVHIEEFEKREPVVAAADVRVRALYDVTNLD